MGTSKSENNASAKAKRWQQTMNTGLRQELEAAQAARPNIAARFAAAEALAGGGVPETASPVPPPSTSAGYLFPDQIEMRQVDARPVNDEHIRALAENVATLGLIQPIVVDRRHRLLAGAHRRVAIDLLKRVSGDAAAVIKEFPGAEPEVIEVIADGYRKHFSRGVPVHVMDFDSQERPELSLAVESAENEHRRDFTREELSALIVRLRNAGYRDTTGRPRNGERALGPALSLAIGKSLRTVRKLLAAEAARAKPAADQSNAAEVVLDPEIVTLQEELTAANVKMDLKDRKGRGVLMLHYQNHDELKALLKRLHAG